MLMNLHTDSRCEQKSATSSMYREALNCRPLLTGIVTCLRLASFPMNSAKGYTLPTNKEVESGQPCLTPDLIRKLSDSYPLIEAALMITNSFSTFFADASSDVLVLVDSLPNAWFGKHIPHVPVQYPVKHLFLVQVDEAAADVQNPTILQKQEVCFDIGMVASAPSDRKAGEQVEVVPTDLLLAGPDSKGVHYISTASFMLYVLFQEEDRWETVKGNIKRLFILKGVQKMMGVDVTEDLQEVNSQLALLFASEASKIIFWSRARTVEQDKTCLRFFFQKVHKERLLSICDQFELVSGAKVNRGKSKAMFFGNWANQSFIPLTISSDYLKKFVKKNTFDHQSLRKWSARSILETLRETGRVNLVMWFPEQTVRVIWQNVLSRQLSNKHQDITWLV
eukprot:g46456.t1